MIYSQQQRKNHIKEIQEYLYAISFFNKNIIRIIPDGIYGRETAIAVKSFQKEYGLPITGEVDRNTWNSIVKVYKAYIGIPPESLNVFPANGFILKKGTQGSLMYIVQVMLYDIAITYGNMTSPDINGIFDIRTMESVQGVQKISQLNTTGNIDSPTWNSIVKTYLHLNNELKY